MKIFIQDKAGSGLERERQRDRELTKYPKYEDGYEDAVILPLSWLNNVQQRGRIRYLHVHPQEPLTYSRREFSYWESLVTNLYINYLLSWPG